MARKPATPKTVNILIVGQGGRLQYEAILFAASLRRATQSPRFKLWIAEPQPGPLWPTDPTIRDKEARALGICHALTEKYSLLLPGKEYSSSWHVVDPVVIALPISLVVLVVVSLLTKPPAREHLERCFGKKS